MDAGCSITGGHHDHRYHHLDYRNDHQHDLWSVLPSRVVIEVHDHMPGGEFRPLIKQPDTIDARISEHPSMAFVSPPIVEGHGTLTGSLDHHTAMATLVSEHPPVTAPPIVQVNDLHAEVQTAGSMILLDATHVTFVILKNPISHH